MFKTIFFATFFFGSVSFFSQSLEWAHTFGADGDDKAFSITTDAAGNVYTSGFFEGSADFSNGIDEFILNSVGERDVFITKHDSEGAIVWAKKIGGFGNDDANTILLDGSGNLLISGSFKGSVDFDMGVDSYILSSEGESDAFILNINLEGDFNWAKNIGGNQLDFTRTIELDASGNIYLAGNFSNTVDFDPGPGLYELSEIGYSDMFIAKYSPSFELLWVKSFGGGFGYHEINSIEVSSDGSVFLSGGFYDTIDFDPNDGEVLRTASSKLYTDLFILHLSSSGDYGWVVTTGDSGYDNCYSIQLGSDGNLYCLGHFGGEITFDQNGEPYSISSLFGGDAFLCKIDLNGNLFWLKAIGANGYDVGRSLVLDADDNVYCTGYFSFSIDLDPSDDLFELQSVGDLDVFVAKYNSEGIFLWGNSLGSVNDDLGFCIWVTSNGEVLTAGSLKGEADFDPSTNEFILPSYGLDDCFIQKFNQPVGVAYPQLSSDLRLYPNPGSGVFYLFGDAIMDCYDFSVINVYGSIVKQGKMCHDDRRIDLTDQSSGFYIITLGAKEFKAIKL